MNKRRIQRIKKAIIGKPYIFSFIFIFFLYVILNVFINQLNVSLSVLTGFAAWFLILFLFFNFLLIPFLVALTLNLTFLRFKESGFGRHTGATGLGIFSGFLGGACPGWFVGLFPAFLGIFGVTSSLSVLPLFGLEIQLLSGALLILAIFLLTKDIVCNLPIKKQTKSKKI